MEHFLHLGLILLCFLFGLTILLRERLKNGSIFNLKQIPLLVLILVFSLHFSPFGPVLAQHHQSQDLSSVYHPCCIPQDALNETFVSVSLQPQIFTRKLVLDLGDHLFLITILPNSRAPPLI